MNWYYADQGQQKGPVEEAELDELVGTGGLTPSTLIWTEGMPEWRSYSSVRALRLAALPTAEFLFEKRCSCCGRALEDANAIDVGDRVACPDCKAVLVERLREGEVSHLPGTLPYSGFWIRFSARMADYTLLSVIQAVLTSWVFLLAFRRRVPDGTEAFSWFGISTLAGMVMTGVYETVMLGTRGATLGKMLCYMRVVHADGSRLGMSGALGRFSAELLSRLTLGAGYVMAGFDLQKRALHDRIAGTRVIDVPPAHFDQPKLEPVSREIQCGNCRTPLPEYDWNSLAPLPCPGCSMPVQAIAFPAIAKPFAHESPEAKEGEGEAGCYYHDANRAVTTCEDCGRFLCPLCDLDAGTRHMCPNCFSGHFNAPREPAYVQRRILYDSVALAGAILPAFTIYFTLLTAPAVVGFSIWSWNKPGSVTPRTKWRFVAALLISGFNLLFIVAVIATLVTGAFR